MGEDTSTDVSHYLGPSFAGDGWLLLVATQKGLANKMNRVKCPEIWGGLTLEIMGKLQPPEPPPPSYVTVMYLNKVGAWYS